jgi:uncharacterized protein
MRKMVFNVKGMTCSHCERAVESAVKNIAGVTDVKALAAKGKAVVKGNESFSHEAVTAAITEAGYSAEKSDDDEEELPAFSWWQFAGILATVAFVLLLVHQTIGLSSFPVVPHEASLGLVFVAGLLTSLHCIAMCGGINLSQCLSQGKACAGRFKGIFPSSLYNGGRIISYTITGAAAGALGSAFEFSTQAKSAIMIGAGIFMIVMGLKFLGLFSRLPRLQFIGSSSIISRIHIGKYSPAAVGLLSGLMPCGPLQAMQLFALGTGSAFNGAVSMFVFAAGTTPLMFALGALSSFFSARFNAAMFKVGGVVIMLLALFMISNGLNLSGTSVIAKTSGSAVSAVQNNVQIIRSGMTPGSYQPITVQKGVPVKWILAARESDLNGCNQAIIIPEYNIKKRLVPGENVIEFTPTKSGFVTFTCWMGMIASSINVVDNVTQVSNDSVVPPVQQSVQCGSSCGRCSGTIPQQFKN